MGQAAQRMAKTASSISAFDAILSSVIAVLSG